MKWMLVSLSLFVSHILFAQDQNVNKNGLLIDGYDVVAYFSKEVKKGKKEFKTTYKGSTLYFSSAKNLNAFKSNSEKYYPMYGGWCAYAMGLDGTYVEIDPETYEIRDGKLYLFYNKFFTNTLELWHEEGAERLKKQADINWVKLKKE